MANIKYKDSSATLYLGATSGTDLTDQERTRGEEAAIKVLGNQAVAAYQAYLEDPNAGGLSEMWRDAETAAIRAACHDWSRYPEDLELELHGLD